MITIVVGIIPFRIVNKPEPVVGHFEEKVSNPEIEISINVNSFVSYGQLFKNYSERHVNQNVAYSSVIPEKMAIVVIVPVVIMYKERWLISKPANYMSPSWVVVIITVEPV